MADGNVQKNFLKPKSHIQVRLFNHIFETIFFPQLIPDNPAFHSEKDQNIPGKASGPGPEVRTPQDYS